MSTRSAPIAIERIARPLFWAALLLVTVVSLWPLSIAAPVDHADKLVHFFFYLGLGLLAWWGGLWPSQGRFAWIVALALIAHGIAIELGQSLVPNRFASLGDALANAAGVLGAAIVARLSRH